MNNTETDRIAAAIHQLRPDWPTTSIRTILNRPELHDRPRRDVAVALAWVASESTTTTPARVLEAGPWWHAALTEQGDPRTRPDRVPPELRCTICGRHHDYCRYVWANDHDFESLADIRHKRTLRP